MERVPKLVITALAGIIAGDAGRVRRRVDRNGFDYREEGERRGKKPATKTLIYTGARVRQAVCVGGRQGRKHNVGGCMGNGGEVGWVVVVVVGMRARKTMKGVNHHE